MRTLSNESLKEIKENINDLEYLHKAEEYYEVLDGLRDEANRELGEIENDENTTDKMWEEANDLVDTLDDLIRDLERNIEYGHYVDVHSDEYIADVIADQKYDDSRC